MWLIWELLDSCKYWRLHPIPIHWDKAWWNTAQIHCIGHILSDLYLESKISLSPHFLGCMGWSRCSHSQSFVHPLSMNWLVPFLKWTVYINLILWNVVSKVYYWFIDRSWYPKTLDVIYNIIELNRFTLAEKYGQTSRGFVKIAPISRSCQYFGKILSRVFGKIVTRFTQRFLSERFLLAGSFQHSC